jgi:hypothetical protein
MKEALAEHTRRRSTPRSEICSGANWIVGLRDGNTCRTIHRILPIESSGGIMSRVTRLAGSWARLT